MVYKERSLTCIKDNKNSYISSVSLQNRNEIFLRRTNRLESLIFLFQRFSLKEKSSTVIKTPYLYTKSHRT